MTLSRLPMPLLIVAHGERRPGTGNAAVAAVAERLRPLGRVGYALLRGEPSIPAALKALGATDLIVYPLFMAEGYFTTTLLPQLLSNAGALGAGRCTILLPPLGRDPGLADVILRGAQAARESKGWPEAEVVLLAHGSRKSLAPRQAVEAVARRMTDLGGFRAVHVALLEESPSLIDVAGVAKGPLITAGLFSGEGLHGGEDVQRLIRETGRDDIVFAGNVGAYEGVAELIKKAVVSLGGAATDIMVTT